jgi:hypothetical protein
MKDFKQTIDNDVIPVIKRMIMQEEIHLSRLKKMRQTPMVAEFIENSESELRRLNTMLRRYETYCLN